MMTKSPVNQIQGNHGNFHLARLVKNVFVFNEIGYVFLCNPSENIKTNNAEHTLSVLFTSDLNIVDEN